MQTIEETPSRRWRGGAINSISAQTKTDPQLVRLALDLRRGERIKCRDRIVHPLQEELDVTGDLTFTTFGFLQLIPPPDRLVVRQRTEVDGELTCVAAMACGGLDDGTPSTRRDLGRRGAAPMKSAPETSSTSSQVTVSDGDEPSPGTSRSRTNCSWNLGSRHFLTVWLFQGSSTPVSWNVHRGSEEPPFDSKFLSAIACVEIKFRAPHAIDAMLSL